MTFLWPFASFCYSIVSFSNWTAGWGRNPKRSSFKTQSHGEGSTAESQVQLQCESCHHSRRWRPHSQCCCLHCSERQVCAKVFLLFWFQVKSMKINFGLKHCSCSLDWALFGPRGWNGRDIVFVAVNLHPRLNAWVVAWPQLPCNWVTLLTVAAGIASFSHVLYSPWHSDVILPCVAVGDPPPSLVWKKRYQKLMFWTHFLLFLVWYRFLEHKVFVSSETRFSRFAW